MLVTYEDAAKAQDAIEDKMLPDPNVVSVGVIAEKNELGEPTGDYVIQVGVISARNYQKSVVCGHSLIPSEYQLDQSEDSQVKKYVRIQVVETSEIKALSAIKNALPKAIDDILTTRTGNSGACLFKCGAKLLFSETFHNRLAVALSSLSTAHQNQYPLKKRHNFSSNYTPSIFQKRSYSTSPAPAFYQKSVTYAPSLKNLPIRYKIAAAASSIGFYTITMKLFDSVKPKDGPWPNANWLTR